MSVGETYLAVITTVESEAEADRLAETIIESGLAACVQMQNIRSVYQWDGKLCREQEVLLTIKTRANRFSDLEKHIKANHTYQTPEIVALPIVAGSTEYLRWIDASVRP